jgi:hypothetical protein
MRQRGGRGSYPRRRRRRDGFAVKRRRIFNESCAWLRIDGRAAIRAKLCRGWNRSFTGRAKHKSCDSTIPVGAFSGESEPLLLRSSLDLHGGAVGEHLGHALHHLGRIIAHRHHRVCAVFGGMLQ